MKERKLKIDLDKLYSKYKQKYSSEDPVWNLHNFKNELDIEVIGLIASCYAYGQIGVFNKFINDFINRVDEKPYNFINNFNLHKDGKLFKGMNYRFNNEYDLMNLLENIRINILKYGSLKNLFLQDYSDEDVNILKALKYF
ncbi:MAG: DUF2400 family protein, partial [Ignavibacteriae bacterium]|nr:DUF2400 family protein [Ignavibacteriota bacterium]